MKTACTPTKATDCFHNTNPEGFVNLFYQSFWRKSRRNIMENKRMLLEQIERLLAIASETQLRILYMAALYLV